VYLGIGQAHHGAEHAHGDLLAEAVGIRWGRPTPVWVGTDDCHVLIRSAHRDQGLGAAAPGPLQTAAPKDVVDDPKAVSTTTFISLATVPFDLPRMGYQPLWGRLSWHCRDEEASGSCPSRSRPPAYP
jgi:hypothetical protein